MRVSGYGASGRRSPDLRAELAQLQFAAEQEFEGFQVAARFGHVAAPGVQAVAVDQVAPHVASVEQRVDLRRQRRHVLGVGQHRQVEFGFMRGVAAEGLEQFVAFQPHVRSEEHTSELQSLMRISYAVFCLKKKKTEQLQIKTMSEHK